MTERSDRDLIEAMLAIETTPRTVDNIRSTSLAMRKLPAISSSEHDGMLIAFCFGLLTINFAPLWSDACAVLKAISDRSGQKIWERAFTQLTLEDIHEKDESSETSKPGNPKSESLPERVWNENQLDYSARLQQLYDSVWFSIPLTLIFRHYLRIHLMLNLILEPNPFVL